MNILYLMNVDWNWIKQRPHFIAEGLIKNNHVVVLYQHRYSRRGYQNRKKEKYIRPVYVIPKGDCNNTLRKINTLIWRFVIKKICKQNNIDCIYITYPTQIKYIKGYSGKIIYDCMDNHAAFIKDNIVKDQLIGLEQNLVYKSDAILCSSLKLEEVLISRYGRTINSKLRLVRNGYDGEILKNFNIYQKDSGNYIFAYFGTISTWFNFDFLLRSLDEIPNIEYRLIGPLADISIPTHPRIHYIGSIEHNKLYESIKDARCLIMPFVVNEIIESVDPVKLYEYINFNKDIIVSKYDEINRFEPFVYFYNDYDDYISQIRKVIDNKEIKYNNKAREEFLNSNSWKNRVQQVEEVLINIKDDKINEDQAE